MAYLAQYSVRAKQAYVYRTNRIRQITGASQLIKDALATFLPQAAAEAGCPLQTTEKPFVLGEVLQGFASGMLGGVVLFEGGGNLTVLYPNREFFLAVNRVFTRNCLQKSPGLTALCAGTEIDLRQDDYTGDCQKLMRAVEIEKSKMVPVQFSHATPLTLMERGSMEPSVKSVLRGGGRTELSAESAAKIAAFEALSSNDVGLLDELITDHGTESLLAVVYADGNGMGDRVRTFLKGKTGYDASVNGMRNFAAEIDNAFVKSGFDAVQRRMEALRQENKNLPKSCFGVRKVIDGGDEITIICNARWALQVALAYLQGLPEGYSSCAGIAVFHSHYPFSDAYRTAEGCCENAKKIPHTERDVPQSWLDWQYIHAGIAGDPLTMREMQGTVDCMARPWQASGPMHPGADAALLCSLPVLLRDEGVTRTNIKKIGLAFEESPEAGKTELARVCSRHPDLAQKLGNILPGKRLDRALYDVAEMYDLWFAKPKKGGVGQ